jgi:hypothetical protein
VADRDFETKSVSHALNADLPKPASTAIAPAAVRGDQQFLRFSVDAVTHLTPSVFARSAREFRRVVIKPNADPTLVAVLVVDSVWDRHP